MAMNFQFAQQDAGLSLAISYCRGLAEKDAFWQAIADVGTFEWSEVAAADIARFMRSHDAACQVRIFNPGWLRYRKTVAYVDPDRVNQIFCNRRFLGNSVARKVNTLAHEFVHVVDFFGDQSGRIQYGHGDQSSDGKDRAAPYAIGAIAQGFYERDHPSHEKGLAPEAELEFECDLGPLPDAVIED